MVVWERAWLCFRKGGVRESMAVFQERLCEREHGRVSGKVEKVVYGGVRESMAMFQAKWCERELGCVSGKMEKVVYGGVRESMAVFQGRWRRWCMVA